MCIRDSVWKYQLFKTSGLQFDNWILGPWNFSGLLRNKPLGILERSLCADMCRQSQSVHRFLRRPFTALMKSDLRCSQPQKLALIQTLVSHIIIFTIETILPFVLKLLTPWRYARKSLWDNRFNFDWRWLSGRLESWEGLLLATDVPQPARKPSSASSEDDLRECYLNVSHHHTVSQDSSLPDDHFRSRYVTPGFKSIS